ncbi:hypothetical protein KJ762_07100 [bacterium]|nr:hypothetical protein [bacterium]MBU1064488.1 hypothetical protein [bacterium]MBU1634261.1 hypothetical protein [bacterium]MBU1872158.1 hypothetical protein [bacterium]
MKNEQNSNCKPASYLTDGIDSRAAVARKPLYRDLNIIKDSSRWTIGISHV